MRLEAQLDGMIARRHLIHQRSGVVAPPNIGLLNKTTAGPVGNRLRCSGLIAFVSRPATSEWNTNAAERCPNNAMRCILESLTDGIWKTIPYTDPN